MYISRLCFIAVDDEHAPVLCILMQLIDCRASGGKTTLMHYLIEELRAKQELLSLPQEMEAVSKSSDVKHKCKITSC